MQCSLGWWPAVVPCLAFAILVPAGDSGQEASGGRPETQPSLVITEKHRFPRPHSLLGLAFSPDGKELCVQEYTGEKAKTTFLAFNLTSGEQRRDGPPLRFPEFAAGRRVPLVPDGKRLLFLLPDGKRHLNSAGSMQAGYSVQLRDLKDGTLLREFHRHIATLGKYWLSADGKLLASSQGSGTFGGGRVVNVSEVESGKELAELKGGHDQIVTAIALNPSGWQAATIGGDFVQVWDLKTAKPVRKLEFAPRAQGVAYSPNAKWLAIATDIAFAPAKNGEIIFLDAKTFEKAASVERARGCGAVDIVFNPTGTLIAAGPRGNIVQVWELSEKAERPGPAKKDSPK